MGQKGIGIYHKFNVSRTDGRDGKGNKHYQCFYFVLDLTHDPHAIPAIRAYAEACIAEYPELAQDLLQSARNAERRIRLERE